MAVSDDLLKKIDGLKLSPWASDLRQQYFDVKPGVAGERVALTVDSWKETEGQPLAIRWAELVKKVLDGVPTPIFKGQRLAGSLTKYLRGAYPYPDWDGTYLLPLLKDSEETMPLGGQVERAIISKEDQVRLVAGAKFWQGKTPVDSMVKVGRSAMGNWYEDLVEAGTADSRRGPGTGPTTFFNEFMNRGLRSYIAEAEDHIRQWKESESNDVEKLWFWQSSVTVLEAAVSFARRYAEQTRKMATTETDPAWKSELEQIAIACDRVPENPPRSFREALQSIVLIYLSLSHEDPMSVANGYGLMDQYLYPYFKKDLDGGAITLDEASDLLCSFMFFATSLEWVKDTQWRDFLQRGRLTNIGIGGTDRTGKDVTNELSYLFVHNMGLLKLVEPHLTIRWNKDMPVWLMRKAMEVNCLTRGGVPHFQNGDHIVNQMANKRGVDMDDALEWSIAGCSQADPGNGKCGMMRNSLISVPLALDMMLHNGIISRTGKQLGPQTGDPRNFGSFEEIWEAFDQQMQNMIRKQLRHDTLLDQVRLEHYRKPLQSAVLSECMKKGLDINMGGLNHYRTVYKMDRGLVPTGDSLMAIKHLVFDQKTVTMDELINTLDQNFEGERGEEIRQMCLAAPKYGNDEDEPDRMLFKVADLSGEIIQSVNNIWGYPYACNRNGESWHYMAGKTMGALPTGRKAGEPMPDASASAMQGMDRKGPTAFLNSALKADFGKQASQAILTLKILPQFLGTTDLVDKVIALNEGFFKAGGTYVQYNIVDNEILRKAQRKPEEYKDLMVRVGGYSAYFINLSHEIQEELISRTEHTLA